jgi:hypothetical protein
MLRVGGFGYDDRAIYRMAWTFEGLNGRVEGTSYLSSGYIATVVIEMWCYCMYLPIYNATSSTQHHAINVCLEKVISSTFVSLHYLALRLANRLVHG